MSTQFELNTNLAQMLKGGVIMDITTPEQAKIAEEAGACSCIVVVIAPDIFLACGFYFCNEFTVRNLALRIRTVGNNIPYNV